MSREDREILHLTLLLTQLPKALTPGTLIAMLLVTRGALESRSKGLYAFFKARAELSICTPRQLIDVMCKTIVFADDQ